MVNYLLNLTELDGKNGFTVSGINDGDRLGAEVNNAGDINGDGFDDLILSAPFAAEPKTETQQYYPYNQGEVYIIFGSNNFAKNLDLNSLDGSNGFMIRGLANDARLGEAVSSAGDFNGDGFDDLIIGAPYAEKTFRYPNKICYSCVYDYRGEVYTIFGSNKGFAANLDLNSLDDNNGFFIKSIGDDDRLGRAVSGMGDINGDGFDDLIIGAPYASVSDENNREGEVYVVFGSNKGFAANFDLASLDGNNGFVVRGLDEADYLGKAVSNAGDINNDGLDDFIITAAYANGVYRGETYVIFGRKSGFAANLDLNSLDGSNGFLIQDVDGEALLDLGNALGNAGDINGDGFDDLIIGAPSASISTDNSQEGEAYVVFGSDKDFTARLDLNTLDGSNGFVVRGLKEGDRLGSTVSGAGDINDDGFDDIIIGGSEVYVIYGNARSFAPIFDLANLGNNEGFALTDFGGAVSNAGDVNGDGLDDLVIGAPSVSVSDRYNSLGDRYSNQGQAYILFGFQSLALDGTETDDTLTGGVGSDTLKGLRGNDRLAGLGAADTLLGGVGDDTILAGDGNDIARGEADNDSIDGGNGDDSLFGNNGRDTLDGGVGNDLLEGGLGSDTLSGSEGADTFTGNLAQLDGDIITDLTTEDEILVKNASFTSDSLTIALDSAILNIDVDLDGTIDSAIALEGNFTEADFKVESVAAEDNSDTSTVIKFSQPETKATVYRFFNSSVGAHFYTANKDERDYVRENLKNYDYEGASYKAAPEESDPLTGAVPVYRFFNKNTGVHLYTVSEVERDYVRENLDNWSFENIAYYGYEEPGANRTPLYRFYNRVVDAHFYTPSAAEKEAVLQNLPNYQLEGSNGIAFYVEPLEV
ncbi:FG-GAP repeat protein [Myxosarcina sp. GI1]|uniref:FG-GAP repeat protein n=1 Tax=Myxosarcina sp. GI1 TaxID=1541065 RepID=UPI00068C07AE|nr:FG-GAP repeat protein [Myxosarcina sp. GI1]